MGEAALGVYFAGVLLLGLGGAHKIMNPDGVAGALTVLGVGGGPRTGRALGALELALAGAAVAGLGAVTASLVCAFYLALALVAARLNRAGHADCGCLGGGASPASATHVALNASFAGAAALVALDPPAGLRDSAGGSVSRTLLAAVLVLVTCRLAHLAITDLPRLARATERGNTS